MKLIIDGVGHDLFASITGATLADLKTISHEAKIRGFDISIRRLREYLVEDLLQSPEVFGYIDTDEKVLCLQALTFLCRRHDGEDTTFAQQELLKLDQLQMDLEVELEEAAPKAQTDSARDDDTPPLA